MLNTANSRILSDGFERNYCRIHAWPNRPASSWVRSRYLYLFTYLSGGIFVLVNNDTPATDRPQAHMFSAISWEISPPNDWAGPVQPSSGWVTHRIEKQHIRNHSHHELWAGCLYNVYDKWFVQVLFLSKHEQILGTGTTWQRMTDGTQWIYVCALNECYLF